MTNLLIIFSALFLFSCQGTMDKKVISPVKRDAASAKVEVYYFHQSKRCKTCIAVGELAKQFVKDNYESMNNKDVLYRDINISLEENQNIADKFQVNWSGLYILNHNSKGEVTDNLTEFAFMYAVDNPDTVIKVLKGKISKYLNYK
jgi:hypothetical protein